MGVYVLDPSLLELIEDGVYLDFPDLVLRALAAGERVGSYRYDGLWLDIGRHEDYERAIAEFSEMDGLLGTDDRAARRPPAPPQGVSDRDNHPQSEVTFPPVAASARARWVGKYHQGNLRESAVVSSRLDFLLTALRRPEAQWRNVPPHRWEWTLLSLPIGRILRSAIALPVIAGVVAIVAISLEGSEPLRAVAIGARCCRRSPASPRAMPRRVPGARAARSRALPSPPP